MHLVSHAEVSLRHKIQISWIRHGLQAQQAMLFALQLLLIKLLILSAPISSPADVAVDLLIQMANIECYDHRNLVRALFMLDHMIYDITPEEEEQQLQFKAHQNVRFDSPLLLYASLNTSTHAFFVAALPDFIL